MPASSTSLKFYANSDYTAMVPGNQYKGAIDSNSAILSPFGMFYVTQNSPAALNVQVDPAFNFVQPGNGLVLQTTASPVTVALTAPTGVNPYYATIYWNSLTNAFGVVYSPQSASPTPILPDDAAMIPLAAVKLSVGQATVTAPNITDLRTWFRFGPVRYSNQAASGTISVDAAGASNIDIDLSYSSAITLNITNCQVGIPLVLTVKQAGSGYNLTLNMTTPGGVAYTAQSKTSGGNFGSFNPFTTGGAITLTAMGITKYIGTAPYWKALYL